MENAAFRCSGSHAFCNDITVDAKGSVYVTDSANPTILKLSACTTTFEVFAQDSAFRPPQAVVLGSMVLRSGSDGTLYVTTVHGDGGELFAW